MKILITGTSGGIGKATAIKFLKEGHSVFGIDIKSDSISGTFLEAENYTHFIADISKKMSCRFLMM